MTKAAARPHHVHHPTLARDVFADDDLVHQVTDSLRPRLAPEMPIAELERRVRSALEELAPVHVTAYLGVLVERRLRGRGPAHPREKEVTTCAGPGQAADGALAHGRTR